jgi:hypothetical protein
MYHRHSNISAGQYVLRPGKSLEDFLLELIGSLFGEVEVFNIYHYYKHIKFNICNRKADYYVKIIDSNKIQNDNLLITYYVGAIY